MTNQAQQSSKKVQIILDDKGGWSRGGRIANAANYRRTRYDITIDGKQAGFMKEDYDGVTAHKGWVAHLYGAPTIRTSTVKVTTAKADIKKQILAR